MRTFLRYLLVAVLLVGAYALVGPYLDRAIYAMRLASMPAPETITMPVSGVQARGSATHGMAPVAAGESTRASISSQSAGPRCGRRPKGSCYGLAKTCWAGSLYGCWARGLSATITPTSTGSLTCRMACRSRRGPCLAT
jgi:hypothetical protein